MAIRLKDGVGLVGMCPQIGLAITVAESVWSKTGETPDLVITSINDGYHSHTSLHYVGHAADLRTHTIPRALVKDCIQELANRLGTDFDVVLEDFNGPNEHAHVEFQPRRRG